LALPAAARSQTPFNLSNDASQGSVNNVGGTATIDLLTVRANSPGIPLRHGNVVHGSERVQLGATVLQQGSDYQMDYEVGVVYIARAMKAGDSVTASYRYDASKAPVSGASNLNPLSALKLGFTPGASFVLGMGMTERSADGQTISTNIFGLNNNFNLSGGGALKGVYYFGDRQRNNSDSLYDAPITPPAGTKPDNGGSSTMILQSLSTKLWGGTVSADYQDISKNFKAFGLASSAGYNAAQLEKEKGMQRMGFGLTGMKFGNSTIGANLKSVGEGGKGIDWRSFSMASGGLQFAYNSQRIDNGFTRFQDLAEADRQQLQKEVGMSRESMAAKFAMKTGSISLTNDKIEDIKSREGIERQKLNLDTSKLKLEFGNQAVGTTFGRIGNLKPEEQALYGREVGLKRQWLSMQANMLGKDYQPIKFAQSVIDSPTGKFEAMDVSTGGKTWSLEHSVRNFDRSFNGFAPLNGTAEGDASIAAIGNMYGKGTAVNVAGERGNFMHPGIDRSFDRFTLTPNKYWGLTVESLRIKGAEDGGAVNTVALTSKNFNLTYRNQNFGQKFTEFSSLMGFEQQKLGWVLGLDRTDLSLNWNVKSTALMYSQLNADSPEGAAKRQQFSLNSKNLQVSANARDVDNTFNSVNMMIDPEKDLLYSLKGFKEHDVKVAWQVLPSLHLDFSDLSSVSDVLNQNNRNSSTVLNWKPSKNTAFNYTKLDTHSDDPMSVLFANMTEKISLFQNFGKYGTINLFDEKQAFDGTNTTGLFDFHRQYLSYEAAIDKNTRIKTEQTRTAYENGDKEDISANTVSTNLNKRVGVSLTDTNIDRGGDDRDEHNRNYGFWYDLGNGVQVAYGYARQLNGDAGATQQNFSIGKTAGQVAPEQAGNAPAATLGNLNFGGGYGERSWDGSTDRTQSFSKMSIGSKKPFKFGFLTDVNFAAGVDTAADYSKWIRENKMFSLSGKLGTNTLGYSYMGQMYTTGVRAVDRTFSLATDQSDKRWLRANLMYKVRTLPWGEQIMIRNYNLTARMAHNVDLSHQLVTNPEVAKGDAILGSVPQAASSSAWKLDFKKPGFYTIGGEWKELRNETAKTLSRTGGLNLTLFEKSGSPLKLFYGLEEVRGTAPHMLTSRYSIQFDQRAGPNQTFSLFAGNVSYEYNVVQGFNRNNWTVHLDYQLRF